MGRRAACKKITYDAEVVAFQIIRRDVCAQLQHIVGLHLANDQTSASTISACEQSMYEFSTQDISDTDAVRSMYVKRFYKLVAYRILSLPPPNMVHFVLCPESRLETLATVRHMIQHGIHPNWAPSTSALYEIVDCYTDEAVGTQSNTYAEAMQQIDQVCGDEAGDSFTQVCRKCKSNVHVEMEAKQTRSADEGMTIEYTCTKCNLTWR